jgi:hypothetical protein
LRFQRSFSIPENIQLTWKPLFTNKQRRKLYLLVNILCVIFAIVWVTKAPHLSKFLNPLEHMVALVVIIAVVVAHIIVHELIHSLCNPGGLFSPKNILIYGDWKAISVAYDGEQSKRGLMLSLIAPFLIITIACLFFLSIIESKTYRYIVSVLWWANLLASSTDIPVFIYIALRIPNQAVFYGAYWTIGANNNSTHT